MVTELQHPLDPLSVEEFRSVAAIVRKARGSDDTNNFIFSSVALYEPPKKQVLAYLHALTTANSSVVDPPDREALVILIDRPSGLVHEIIVSLTKSSIVKWEKLKGMQPTQHPDEMLEAEQMMIKDERIIEECRQLGVTDMSMVKIDPWAVGFYHADKDVAKQDKRRIMQGLMYCRTSEDDNQYAHPLDFTAIYDVNAQEVIDLIRHVPRNSKFERASVPMANHHFLPEHLGQDKMRKDIKPIQITQPEGVSFTLRGHTLDWQKWNMHIGFNYREGVVISNVTYKDVGDQVRPVLYRVSLSEMVVPYANPYEPHTHKMAFDVGEYGLGNMSNSLELGCDCVGDITYMDGVITDLKGEPTVIENAICIHEEDAGLLFKHTDYRSGKAHSVRSRRLVVSNIITAANYDYGLYFYFYQDGTFQYEVKATGELNTHILAEDEDPAPYGTIVAPQVVGQHHQHLFMMRIDPMVDGIDNSVMQVDVVPSTDPVGHPDNRVGNAFVPVTRIYNTTDEAQVRSNADSSRFWQIINESKLHPYTKKPVGFKLVSNNTPPMLPKPGAIVTERAKFATKTVWVTPYEEHQLFPGGSYCSQSEPGMGLPEWTKESASVRDKDIVVWLTFGLNHIPRVEDFPIMPVETCGFHLKPCNFFLGNPGIDIPPSKKQTASAANNSNGCHC
ncbi:copper amine oxidase [Zychaea mexicana]|uniref:copper amine oxidase n=1 Tax=Zychaea mexicana TaxID=64656 RepID=UPI0022FE241F|nr:copper amine oxidase [Zychaea mexicana]KAI9499304.1 copper amine oxidase [Zychaea mexicana]